MLLFYTCNVIFLEDISFLATLDTRDKMKSCYVMLSCSSFSLKYHFMLRYGEQKRRFLIGLLGFLCQAAVIEIRGCRFCGRFQICALAIRHWLQLAQRLLKRHTIVSIIHSAFCRFVLHHYETSLRRRTQSNL